MSFWLNRVKYHFLTRLPAHGHSDYHTTTSSGNRACDSNIFKWKYSHSPRHIKTEIMVIISMYNYSMKVEKKVLYLDGI